MKNIWAHLLSVSVIAMALSVPAAAQQQKPNIVVIFGDDVGPWNVSAYHNGVMGGAHPTSTASLAKVNCSPTITRSNPAPRAAPPLSPDSIPSALDC